MPASALALSAAALAADAARRSVRAASMALLNADPDRGDLVVKSALNLWRSHIEEPPAAAGALAIDTLIRGEDGLGWVSANARRLNERIQYRENGDFAWCGAFAATCYGVNGLRASIRRRDFASCFRLQRWAGENPDRKVALADIRPGDILVVGDGKVVRGTHITIVERVEGSIVHTVEGNARGLLPDGTVGEGVIRRTRSIGKLPTSARCEVSGLDMSGRALHAYRPLEADFDA